MYVCECGINIGATVDVPKVVDETKNLPKVVVAREYKYMCSDPGQTLIKKDIEELGLDKVVVASCSPRMHEPTFRTVCKEAGLNPFCFEMANIREQCSWVHSDKEKATQKAIALVRAAVARASLLEALQMKEVGITPQALVIGGGIAGIQAALDIADTGFKTYLVERTPSIGGRMSQLDKTFPTLDCSACILTPKMVDVGRHANIELLTYSEIEKVDGYVGNFKVSIRKKARFVDEETCTACNDCVEVCPVRIPSEFESGMAERTAIFRPFAQAVPNVYAIEKRGNAPCKSACPAGIHVQGYVALIAEGRFREAYDLIQERMPFPGICGRVCHHPCETDCRRAEKDSPVAIEYLKRFAADWVAAHPDEGIKEDEEATTVSNSLEGKKVAIIGSGPVGLTVARELADESAQCDIFEALPVAGGMMNIGIPSHRLPKPILDKEINDIVSRPNVKLNLKSPVQLNGKKGKSKISLSDLRDQYDAVFLGIGAHKNLQMRIPGENLKGVYYGADFLRKINLKHLGVKSVRIPKIGKRVAVIGGGNVAIDSAMTAMRAGGDEVYIVYRRSRAEMPAYDWEIEEAAEEGVQFIFLTNPIEVKGKDGKASSITLQRMRLGEPDESGRRRPVPIEGDTFTLPIDSMIIAIGQKLADIDPEIKKNNWGWIAADEFSLQTNLPDVFTAGDAQTGPRSIVEVVGAGHQAAESIRRYLLGEDLLKGRELEKGDPEPEFYDPEDWVKTSRHPMPQRDPEARIDFDEIYLGYTEEQAVAEAKRCLGCGVCSECMACVDVCGPGSINHNAVDELEQIDVGSIIVATGFDLFDATNKPEYGYGTSKRIMTGIEFERLVSASGPTEGHIEINGKEPKRVAFIQCVGSRDRQGHEYCSRVCCMYTAKHAHLVSEKIPGSDLTVYYTDVRAFGKGCEEFYVRVQGEGVNYRKRELEDPIEVVPNEDGETIVIKANGHPDLEVDLVVLATAIEPRKDALDMMRTLNIGASGDGFMLEAHPKLRPMDTFTDGIFLAGCCQAPKDIPDTVAQASGAAAMACNILSKDTLEIDPLVSSVNEVLCRGCGFCVEVCPYDAIGLESVNQFGHMADVARVNEALCKGCGSCAGACLSGAIQVMGFNDKQIHAAINALGESS